MNTLKASSSIRNDYGVAYAHCKLYHQAFYRRLYDRLVGTLDSNCFLSFFLHFSSPFEFWCLPFVVSLLGANYPLAILTHSSLNKICAKCKTLIYFFPTFVASTFLLPAERQIPPEGKICTHSTGEPWSIVRVLLSQRISHTLIRWS